MSAKNDPSPCGVAGCPNPHYGGGWCRPHHQAWRRTGDPLTYQGPRVRGGCNVDECEKPHYTHGYCRSHSKAFKSTGDPLNSGNTRTRNTGPCTVDGCEKGHYARGWCKGHYNANQRTGDPLNYGKPRAGDLVTRLWQYVDRRGPDECWPWTGAAHGGGYGQLHVNGGPRTAHRVIHELQHGPVPAGFHVDHTCHNQDTTCPGGDDCWHRKCCNPAHLEAVPAVENTLRSPHTFVSQNLAKTHCPRGHAYEGANLYVVPKTGHRQCRACRPINKAARSK